MRRAEIKSDHFVVRAKIRWKNKRSKRTKKIEIKKWDIGKENKREVKEDFIKEVTSNVQNTKLDGVEYV